MKKTAITLGICAIALTSGAANAEAGHKKKFRHFNSFHLGFVHIQPHWTYRSCWKFKRKYHRTGKRFWLKKYRSCRKFNHYGW